MVDKKLDWVHLPSHIAPESLCLHDGELLSVHSDLLQRTLTLEVDAPHLRAHAPMGEEEHFVFYLQNVESVRVTTWVIWPGPSPEVKGKPMKEQGRLVQEYQAKWREGSVSWNDFEASFSSNTLDIYHAEIARQDGYVAIAFAGSLNGEEFDSQPFSFYIRAEQIAVGQGCGSTNSIEHFLELVQTYATWFDLQHPQ